jgi:N-dimethylarginine dimethylaminohydrolase
MLTFQSDVEPLRRVLVRRAEDAFGSPAIVHDSWRELGYRGAPDIGAAKAEHEAFVEILQGAGAEVLYLEHDSALGMDSLYPRDASILCRDGAILCRMGKATRAAEPRAHRDAYERLGVPVLGAIEGDGRLEGGDVAWIDDRTLVAGLGYRTNAAGIEQLRALLADRIDELIVVPLPHWRGPKDVFHLMSMFSPLDRSVALVYSPLLPVPFRNALLERGFVLVDVPDDEFETMGCNALALRPGQCVLVEGNAVTRRRVERAGIEVIEYTGVEISSRGSGGPTCLTRPIVRMPTGSRD